MTLELIIFAISFFILLWAGKILPRAIGNIARALHLSEFITAFILVAAATSIPELFLGISSAIQNTPTLSLGNIFGANLANMTLVLGVGALFAGKLPGDGKISSQNFWLIFGIALIPAILASDGVLSRVDGMLLLVSFGLYLAKLFHDGQYFHKEMNGLKKTEGPRFDGKALHSFGQFLIGIIFLVGSSFALIWATREIVDVYFGAHFFLFGTIVIALGTTLPEMMFAIRAGLSGHSGAILGNALGSVAFNAAGILGLVAVMRPITVVFSREILLVTGALFVAFVLFHLFVYTRKALNRKEALVLLAVYAVFLFMMLR